MRPHGYPSRIRHIVHIAVSLSFFAASQSAGQTDVHLVSVGCIVGDIIQVRPQVLLEIQDNWTINEMQSIAGGMPVAAHVQGTSDYLATLKCDWRIGLSEHPPFPLSIGFRDMYDSNPGLGSKHNDLKAWADFTLNF